jgi:hypothetical protein
MLSAAAAYVHNLFANAEEEQVTEHEVQAKMLKDLNFDKMSSRELQAFLQEKKFQDDVQIMLRVYLEIVLKRLAVTRDNLLDEVSTLQRASRSTAYQTRSIQHLDEKVQQLESTRHMLAFDLSSFGLGRSSRLRTFAVRVSASPYFQSLVFMMTVCNCGLLAYDSPPKVGRCSAWGIPKLSS